MIADGRTWPGEEKDYPPDRFTAEEQAILSSLPSWNVARFGEGAARLLEANIVASSLPRLGALSHLDFTGSGRLYVEAWWALRREESWREALAAAWAKDDVVTSAPPGSLRARWLARLRERGQMPPSGDSEVAALIDVLEVP